MLDFRRIALFCLEKRLSKHKMTIFSKNLGGPWPLLPPPGYVYALRRSCLPLSAVTVSLHYLPRCLGSTVKYGKTHIS